jgi:hypothetical protein
MIKMTWTNDLEKDSPESVFFRMNEDGSLQLTLPCKSGESEKQKRLKFAQHLSTVLAHLPPPEENLPLQED